MTPRQRFLARLAQEPADRPCVGNATSVATIELMEACGHHFPQAHLEAEAMAALGATSYEILGYDTIAPVFSVQQEAAALGCEVDWGRPDRMPEIVGCKCRIVEDLVLPTDWLQQPTCQVVLQALALLRRRYPQVALIGKVFGPWTLAYHLFGVQNFLILTLDDPGAVRTILRRLMPVPVAFARAQLEAGADAITLADHATGDLVSAAMYRELLWPLHRELAQAIPGPIVLHICGNTADRLAHIAHTGFAAFHFDSRVPAQRAREIVDAQGRGEDGRRRIALMGNINNPRTLLHGTPQDVRAEVAECLRQEVEIIAPECAVPLTTPTANLQAVAG